MKNILTRLFNHETLTAGEAGAVLRAITEGKISDAQIASFLTVFQMRGVTVDELIGFREALLSSRVPVDFSPYKPIDIVGTGGDGKNTFNISTCACFVVAGAGYKVAKHGNYGATSVSGASDVIEMHGVKFTNDAAALQRSLEQCNIAYLHAPLFNPAMKTVAAIRKGLQVRTIFNLLGPLVNPCKPDFQLLGGAELSQLRLYTNVFLKLGIEFSVVSSLDKYDEISLTSEFKVTTNRYERIYSPEELNLKRIAPDELFGGKTKQEAAQIFDNVLTDSATTAQKQCVLINAAFAIQTIEKEKSIEECLAVARESVESGRAAQTFKKFLKLNS